MKVRETEHLYKALPKKMEQVKVGQDKMGDFSFYVKNLFPLVKLYTVGIVVVII